MAYIGKSPSSGIRNRFTYTATAGQTTFSGSDDHNKTLTYTDAEFADVFLNGIKLDKSDYTATSGTSIVLDEAAAVDDIVEVIAFDTFSVFSGDFSQDVTVGGNLTASAGATITGDLIVDTDTLYVDSTNNNVGIGTNSPTQKVTVSNGTASSPAVNLLGASASQGWLRLGNNADIKGGDDYLGMTFTVGASERMRINSSGNVNIGDATGSGDKVFVLGKVRASSGFKMDGGTEIIPVASETMGFKTNNTERMRIDSSGRLLVGTTTTVGSNNAGIEIGKYSGAAIAMGNATTSGNATHMQFYRGTTKVGEIYSSGTTTTHYVTSSDYRLKEDLQPMTGATERVKALNPVNFAWRSDGSRVDGFIAHEAQTVVPEAIYGTHNEVETWTQDEIDAGDAPANTSAGDNKLDGDGNTIPVYQGIDQSKLVPLLTAALQEAIAKIETLETKVAALEAADV